MNASTLVLIVALSLAACDDGGLTPTEETGQVCYEEVAAATALYCSTFRHCKAVSFQSFYANTKNCSVSVMLEMRGVLEATPTPEKCEGAILDYYDCLNPLGCEAFKTTGVGSCLAESIGLRYACGAEE